MLLGVRTSTAQKAPGVSCLVYRASSNHTYSPPSDFLPQTLWKSWMRCAHSVQLFLCFSPQRGQPTGTSQQRKCREGSRSAVTIGSDSRNRNAV